MKIYDISRELLSAPVYPGDPVPELRLTGRCCTAAFLFWKGCCWTGLRMGIICSAPCL